MLAVADVCMCSERGDRSNSRPDQACRMFIDCIVMTQERLKRSLILIGVFDILAIVND